MTVNTEGVAEIPDTPAMRSGQPWKFLITPSIFTWNKSDSVQLSTVNATKTPEAR